MGLGRSRGSVSAWISVCVLAGLLAPRVQAQLIYVDFANNPGDGNAVTDHREATSGTVSDSLTIGGTSSEAIAQLGRLQGKSQASWSAISPPDPLRWEFMSARSTAGWQDDITINAPVPLGTEGHVVVRVGVNGILSALENGEAAWALDVRLTGGPSLNVLDQFYGNCFGPWHGIPCNELSVNFATFTTRPFTFQFGGTFSLEVILNVSASGQQILGGSAAADLLNTVTWLGFAELVDENQNPVDEFIVTSASGFDWSQPVDVDGDGLPDASDNCPQVYNPGQLDQGGLNAATPDGVGDACQCGDVNFNHQVQINDATIIKRAILGLGPGLTEPALCNVIGASDPNDPDGDGVPNDCEINDATVVKRAILGLGPGIGPVCVGVPEP